MLLCNACTERVSPAHGAPEGVVSFFDYRDPVMRRGIWELKYRGKHAWAEVFGQAVQERLMEELSDHALLNGFRDPLIVPVPLAKKRLRERGYNQAALVAHAIADGLASDSAHPMAVNEDALIRTRETPRQMEIKDKKKRLANVTGAFAVKDPTAVRDRNIILLDDVVTTGATLCSCRDALVAAGARQVLLIAIAH